MKTYASHIERICKIEDIEIASHSRGGRAYRRSRRIKIRPVKSAVTYAIALHETGQQDLANYLGRVACMVISIRGYIGNSEMAREKEDRPALQTVA